MTARSHPYAVRRAVIAEMRAGRSAHLAASLHGVHVSCAIAWARDHGVTLKNYSPPTMAEWERRVAVLSSGVTYREAAKALGLAPRSALELRRKILAGEYPPPKPRRDAAKHCEIAKAEGSAADVASRYGLSVQYVRRLRSQHLDDDGDARAQAAEVVAHVAKVEASGTARLAKQKTVSIVSAVGHALRVMRARQGLSLRAVAELTGCQVQNMSELENGKREPKIGTLERLAAALGTTASKVLVDAERVMGTRKAAV